MCFLNNLLNVYVKHKRCRQIVSICSSDLSSYYLRLCQKSAELNLGLVFGFCRICPEAKSQKPASFFSTENAKFWPCLVANLRTFHVLFTGANNVVAYQKWQISGMVFAFVFALSPWSSDSGSYGAMVRVAGGLVERPLGSAAVVSHPPREPTLGCTTPTSSTTPTSTSRTHCQEECGKLGLDTSRRKNFLRQPLMGDKSL